MARQVNNTALGLIRASEQLRVHAYRDPGGVPTIGYGHTSRPGPPEVKMDMLISAQEAEDILQRDVATFAKGVELMCIRTPSDNQFGAMVSLAFNIGVAGLAGSTVLRLFNAGDLTGAGAAFNLWTKDNGKVLPGLVTRRKAEAALFLTPDPVPAVATVKGTPMWQSIIWGFARNALSLFAGALGAGAVYDAFVNSLAGGDILKILAAAAALIAALVGSGMNKVKAAKLVNDAVKSNVDVFGRK